MIESKCENCGTVFHVPKPGKYLCHTCNNTVIVKKAPPLTSPVLDLKDLPEAKGSGLEYDLVTHSFRDKQDSFFSADNLENDEQVIIRSSIPWENRRRIGFFRAFFLTIKEAITNPRKLFSTASGNGKGLKSAWGYLILVYFLSLMIKNLIIAVIYDMPILPISRYQYRHYGYFAIPKYLLESLISVAIAIVALGALLNFGAWIMGAKTSFSVGQKVYYYSISSYVFTIIPFNISSTIIVLASTIYICSEGLIKFYKMKRVKAVIAAFVPQIIAYLLIYLIIRSVYRF